MRGYNLYDRSRFADTVNLLHCPRNRLQVLDEMDGVYSVESAIQKGIWKAIQVADHIHAGQSH
jgi:hypothetical protein